MGGWSQTLVRNGGLTSFMSQNPVTCAPWIDATHLERHVAGFKLPPARREPWKYTSLKTVFTRLQQPYEDACEQPSSRGQGVQIEELASSKISPYTRKYVNKTAPQKANILTTLNLLQTQHGYGIVSCVAQDQAPVVTIDASDACERLLIVVEENASLEVVEFTQGGNRVIECIVLSGGSLSHRRVQPATDSIEYNALFVNVKRHSSYKLRQYSVGAQLRRNDIVLNIEGEYAQIDVGGGWKLEHSSHLDTQLEVNHCAPGATSHQKFHGVVGDSARAIFNGRIYIARNAPKTDAHLQNKNIAVSDHAAIYTKPELEIYADDVACSHGATSGQLDERQIFYLRSRGVPDTQSRELLLDGFLSEIVEHEDGARLFGIARNRHTI